MKLSNPKTSASISTLSQKNVTFLCLWRLWQISSDSANFWPKHPATKFVTNTCTRPIHILFYMFVLYRVKTSDASERTLRRRQLPVRLVIELESRNFFKRLFNPWHFNFYHKIYELIFLPPKTLNLHKFTIKMRTSAAPDCCLMWSGLHQRVIGEAITMLLDGCTPVQWELMDETSNTCSDNMNVTW